MTNPYLALVAQLETAGGKKTIKGPNGEDSLNLYNIKEFRKGRAGFVAHDKAENSRDAYRVYKTKEEADADFIDLVTRKYPKAAAAMAKPWSAESAREFAEGLKAGGYATDPAYVSKLVRVASRMQVDPTKVTPFVAPVVSPVAAAAREFVEKPVTAWLGDVRSREAARTAGTGVQRMQEETQPSTLAKVGAAMRNATTGRAIDIITELSEDFDEQATPGFKVKPEDVQGVDSQDDLDELMTARSEAEFKFFRGRQQEREERNAVLFKDGMASGIGFSLLGEVADPTNWLAPYAAYRALGQRALVAARAGEKGKAVAISVGEAAASGAAIEGALQIGEGRPDLANFLLAATVDLGVGTFTGIRALNAATVDRAATTVLERELVAIERAQASLGPAASPDAVKAAASRGLAEEVEKPLTEAVRPLARERMLMERPDEMGDAPDVDTGPVGSGEVDLRTQNAMSIMELEDTFGRQIATEFDSPVVQQARVQQAGAGLYDKHISAYTGGEFKNFSDVSKAPVGVTITKAVAADVSMTPAVRTLKTLIEEYLPNSRVILGNKTMDPNANGEMSSFGRNHIIGVVPVPGRPTQVVHTTIHEVGHAVYHEAIAKAPAELVERIRADWLEWVEKAKRGDPEAVQGRFAITSPNAEVGQLKTNKYNLSLDEWMAEQYVKHVEARMVAGEMGKLDKGVISMMIGAIKRLVEFFGKAKAAGLIEPSAAADEFYTAVLNRTLKNTATMRKAVDAGPVSAAAMAPQQAAQGVGNFLTDPVAKLYGLDLLPMKTAADRANAKAMLNLAKKAEAWAVKHPKDEAWDKRAQNLIDNSLFSAASTGLKLLKSNNNIARMLASELLEDASGVAGKRQSTAAISKHLYQRHFLGNSLNDVQSAYGLWAKANGMSVTKDQLTGGKGWERFNREVAEEIEARRNGGGGITRSAEVKRAADSLEKAYDRIRRGQKEAKTLGHQALWDSSVGYMPHKISPAKWLNLSNDQRRVVHQALVDQFVGIEGWDMTFSDNLASEYLKRVQSRATGGHDSPIGGASSGSAEIVEDAMLAMGMTTEEVRKNMQRFNRGAATWTKERLDLDLNKVYDTPQGSFKLLDVFETDQLRLLRGQAGRASGEVALARHGVYGKPGLDILRQAMQYGPDGKRAVSADLEAFDQIAAEFMDAPFGTAGPKWLENVRVLNSVVRLGGIVFNQFGEFINGVAHVGVVRTLAGVGGMKRLRGEIKDLAKGKAVDNPLLSSIERLGGAEFGTDAYKIVMPFDMPDHAYQTYGADSVTAFDKLVRGASYAQAKLSLWRAVHSVQQRAMAEQVVAKIARYVRDGGEDVALSQFGVTPAMQAALKADGVARWAPDGALVEFDVSKIKDPQVAEDLIHAVHRGVSQIIQGTFIGETGKWAHDGYLKLLTQFRTFSLTAMEKQWARQRNSGGVGRALGILVGSMFAAAPIYMARVYAASVGREDQEEFIEERLKPELIARQTLNYVALSGLAGDFLDLGAALAPSELGVKITGGRAGTDTDFVGSVVAPALSLVDDAWKAVQNLDDPERMARVLPGSRLPYVLPAVNALGDE